MFDEDLPEDTLPFFDDDYDETIKDHLAEGFVPTREELGIIARYYYDRAHSIHYSASSYRQVGSSELRFASFASWRLERIENVLGKTAFDKEIANVEAGWAKTLREHGEREASRRPCRRCGGRRYYYDELRDGKSETNLEQYWLRDLCWTCHDLMVKAWRSDNQEEEGDPDTDE